MSSNPGIKITRRQPGIKVTRRAKTPTTVVETAGQSVPARPPRKKIQIP